MSKFLVYGLRHPLTKELRYVGVSRQGMTRPRWHLTPTGRKGNTYRATWLRKLHSEGLQAEIAIVDECESANDAIESEQLFIAYFRGLGARLTNLTTGGDGASGRVCRADTKQKMKLRWSDPALRAQVSEKLKLRGNNFERTDAWKAKVSAAKKGKSVPKAGEHLVGKPATAALIICDQYGVTYPNLGSAETATGISKYLIRKSLKTGREVDGLRFVLADSLSCHAKHYQGAI